jgi:hypothetical protein
MVSIRHFSQREELIIDGMLLEGTLGLLPEASEHLQFQFACNERELSDRIQGKPRPSLVLGALHRGRPIFDPH